MMMAHADGGEWVTARPGATLEEKRLLSAGFTNVVPYLTFACLLACFTFELTGSLAFHRLYSLPYSGFVRAAQPFWM
jgi:hypothetical protein